MSEVVFLAVTLRQVLITVNIVAAAAVVAIIAYRVFSLRRNPEPEEPQNLEPFYEDEDLEGRRLERVLGWSLLFTALIAIALPVYFVFEPSRQSDADEGFDDRAAERGAVLFANEASPEYDATVSLLCANCHGAEGGGGTAPFVIQPEDPSCDPEEEITAGTEPECRPVQVSWRAPSLDDVLLRYSPEQVTEIITFGRPGTPMPAWGVESGEGVLNEQSIQDLVTYLETIQVTPEEAEARATEAIEGALPDAEAAVEDAEAALAEAQAALAAADPSAADAVAEAEADVTSAEDDLEAAIAWRDTLAAASEGEIVFMEQCARCHTKGWSYYDPLDPDAAPPPGPMGGGGSLGPSLIDGQSLRRFPGATGFEMQVSWVAEGAERNRSYGVGGISSGRMPHFNQILSETQIDAVVEYEREL